ncbi:uncharacterized protein LOC117178735 [Belonocnema kinseyi]|uniref:uncharacterized protein LOC117178735 n=1 Tax=Belonocnema kinseyi TaxID=2817044 RepID=UPI00143D0294|nr:uncharacterized protein LOC117178735 [Belonocnema kinseyi]
MARDCQNPDLKIAKFKRALAKSKAEIERLPVKRKLAFSEEDVLSYASVERKELAVSIKKSNGPLRGSIRNSYADLSDFEDDLEELINAIIDHRNKLVHSGAGELESVFDEKRVHLGERISLKYDVYKEIYDLLYPSKFVKDLAKTIWKRTNLVKRYIPSQRVDILIQLPHRSARKKITTKEIKSIKKLKLMRRISFWMHWRKMMRMV